MSDWSSDVCSSDLLGCIRSRSGAIPHKSKLQSGQLSSIGQRHQQAHLPVDAVTARTWRNAARTALFVRPIFPRSSGFLSCWGSLLAPHASRGRTTKLDRYRSDEHTSELQSLMRISYAVFCLKKKIKRDNTQTQ